MKNAILTVFVIFGTLLYSCASKQDVEKADTTSTDAALASTPTIDLYSNGITKLIKTAHCRFQVHNVKESADAIEAAVRKYPAYISASNTKLENPLLENTMTIRVQNEFFQDLLKDIDQQAGYVNFRNVNTEDVAKQFVDLESRLKTKREVELRYTEILRSKAGTIEELLDAEKKIGTLHEEIEATIARINYLRDEVKYSTIQLEFYQTITTNVASINEVSAGKRVTDGLVAGWDGVVNIFVAMVYLWPLMVVVLAGGWFYRQRRKRVAVKPA